MSKSWHRLSAILLLLIVGYAPRIWGIQAWIPFRSTLGFEMSIPSCVEAVRPESEGSGSSAEDSDAVDLVPLKTCSGLSDSFPMHIYFLPQYQKGEEVREKFERTKAAVQIGGALRTTKVFPVVIYSEVGKVGDWSAIWTAEALDRGAVRWRFKLFCPNRLLNLSFGFRENVGEEERKKIEKGEVTMPSVGRKVTESARCTTPEKIESPKTKKRKAGKLG